MLRSLPLLHRIAGQHVVVLAEGTMGEAKARLVTRAGGIPCGEDKAHLAKLAFIALDDPHAAEAAAERLGALGLLVNVADRPELCEFTTPSILDRDPVLIAIGTSGASAGLAKQLRLRLERLLPADLGKLTQKFADARDRIRAAYPDGDDRRRAIDAALVQGGMLDPLNASSVDRFDDWLAGDAETAEGRTIAIDLISDDPEDLTLRQARWLGTADTIFHDSGIPSAILDRSRADALRRELPLPDHRDEDAGLTLILRRPSQQPA